MIYLASPYSGTKEQMQERYEAVLQATATLLYNKLWVYSPIVHCHELAVRYKMPTDAVFWEDYNRNTIFRSISVDVLQLPGWRASKGVNWELALSKKIGMPLRYVSMDEKKIAIHTGEDCSGELICEFALIS